MIFKGNQRAGGDDLASHLLNLYDNDDAELAEVRGVIADDLHGAFAEFEAMATGTRCVEPLYSLSINPGQPMSRDQYREVIAAAEDRLGLTGQPRAVVFHVKGGREHCHVVWSRIDTDRMKAVQLSHDRQKLRALAQEMAAKFGHDLPHGLKEDRGATRFDGQPRPGVADLAMGERAGLAADLRRQDITAAYREARDAAGFIDGLWERGYHLARGDQRGFVVVDRAGNVHSLSRQIAGVKAKELKAFMAPLDPAHLPDVTETRKRIADQLESEALDDVPGPHLRRSPEELRERQAKRRAVMMARWQEVELRQRAERMALHEAHKQERERPFARAAIAVFGLIERFGVLRRVLRPLLANPSLNIEERHRQQSEALERRFGRERQTVDRRLSALDRVERRENKSLARDQRRLDAAMERARQRTLGEFGRAAAGKPEEPDLKPDGQKREGQKPRPRGFGFRP